MQLVASEIKDKLSMSDPQNSLYIPNEGVTLDCSWKSRGWQPSEVVVAAVAENMSKILDVQKPTSFLQ